ncbi:hypothetical protein [Aeromonas cavernicola]|nr:hypothetical protein [Aeromonas cavernicola]
MWFGITAIDSGLSGDEKSYGFGPNETGIRGPGHVARSDSRNYISPYYARTMEITKTQYEKLYEFGEIAISGDEKYFSLYYFGTHNSCIDFTNAALRFAGLNPTYIKPAVTPSRADPVPYEDNDYEGKLKVLDNIPKVKQIPAPFPNSELNMERYNKMPERTAIQRLLLTQQGPDGKTDGTTV